MAVIEQCSWLPEFLAGRYSSGGMIPVSSASVVDDARLRNVLDRLTSKSIEDYYNPYKMFRWPDRLPADMWWMTPGLTTTAGTDLVAELGQDQLFELSRLESVNFYSLNVHGIRELLIEVTKRIHTDPFAVPSQ